MKSANIVYGKISYMSKDKTNCDVIVTRFTQYMLHLTSLFKDLWSMLMTLYCLRCSGLTVQMQIRLSHGK